LTPQLGAKKSAAAKTTPQTSQVKANQSKSSAKEKNKDEAPQPVFKVEPETIMLDPKTWISFKFTANSPASGLISESLVCTAVVGKDR
jgi:hypothetical protein